MSDESTQDATGPADDSLEGALRAALTQAQDASGDTTAMPEQDATDDDPGGHESSETATDDQPSGDADASEQADGDAPAIEAPQHWSEQDRATFAQLPRSGQDFILRRHKEMEADYTRKTTEISDVRKALEPYREQLALAGITEGQAVSRLLAAQRTLEQDPETGFRWLADSFIRGPDQAKKIIATIAAKHGISIDDITTEDDDLDPEVRTLRAELAELRQSIQQREQASQQTQAQSAAQQIAQFAAETAENGDLLRPHFDTVKPAMAALLSAGKANSLEDAYDMAVWAEPSIRSSLVEAERVAARKAAADAARSKATNARKAALPKGSREGAQTESPLTLREELRRQIEASG